MRLVIKEEHGYFWVRLMAKNNKILMSSEGYASRRNARRAAFAMSWALRTVTDGHRTVRIDDQLQHGRRKR